MASAKRSSHPALCCLISPLLAFILPLPQESLAGVEMIDFTHEPEVSLALTPRSGPIIMEIDYFVVPDQARQLYQIMLALQKARLRNGACDWSLARDIPDLAL